MHPKNYTFLCASCSKLTLSATPGRPHALMQLEQICPPTRWEGVLERHYRCTICGVRWRRHTDVDGVDTVFEPLQETQKAPARD